MTLEKNIYWMCAQKTFLFVCMKCSFRATSEKKKYMYVHKMLACYKYEINQIFAQNTGHDTVITQNHTKS